jgi:hyaluronoglucosaminidase
VEAGGDPAETTVSLGAERPGDVSGTLQVDAPAGWQVEPRQQDLTVYRGSGRDVDVRVQVPAGTTAQEYDVPVTFTADGQTVSTTLTVAVHPKAGDTNLATGGTAEASCVEGDGAYPQFDPKYAIDGDSSTRWSSCYDDGAWLQVHLPQSAQLGKVVLHWEASYGEAYEIQTSSDGTDWTTAATVTGGDGGTDTVYLDGTPTATYVRMQGVKRALSYGFSLYELEVYPLA